jgi:hypothetical protein
MKKVDRAWQIRIQRKRERKRLKRRLHSKFSFFTYFTPTVKEDEIKVKHDDRIIKGYDFELNSFLDAHGNKVEYEQDTIPIDHPFSLEKNFNKTIRSLAFVRKSIISNLGGQILIDFTKCPYADFSALFLLGVILDEYVQEIRKLNKRMLIRNINVSINIKRSDTNDVNAQLLANRFIKNVNVSQQEFVPVSAFSQIIKGRKSQKHYAENKKGAATTTIRTLINKSLNSHHFMLTEKGMSDLDGIISEILNNAEDHSPFFTWYCFGNLFENTSGRDTDGFVGEINLAFLNFGYSIFEGFEDTKALNHAVYDEMEALYEYVINSSSGAKKFTKENLFTLYALQEGKSRLKYDKISRGTGTIKFINSFLSLGDYEDESRGIKPKLLIYSGNTMLKCDSAFRPFKIEDAYFLSLNKENSLEFPPSETHIKTLDMKFPGTFLAIKIYMNEAHLKKKVS